MATGALSSWGWRGAIAVALAALFGGGCSSDGASGDGGCASLSDSCLSDQKICLVASDGSASCQPCQLGSYATAAGNCAPIGDNVLSHTFPDNTTASGAEILGMCRSWTVHNPEPMWINAVELEQHEASHHSNWTFVPDSEYDGPDGIWKCADRNYSQLSAALAGGVLYAQSTQANHEVQKFPAGAAIRLPAHVRIISDIHTLNTTKNSITGHSTISLYSMPAQAVKTKLVPFHLTYDELTILPQSTSRFTGECELESEYQQQTQKPFDLSVYYLLPHTHALGTRMFVEAMGGAMEGQTLIDVTGFNGEARGRAYDPPIDLTGATGLRFGCEFTNPRAEEVNWGFDDQEMCEVLGFAATPLAFESRVSEAVPAGSDAGVATFTGGCSTIAFVWDHNK